MRKSLIIFLSAILLQQQLLYAQKNKEDSLQNVINSSPDKQEVARAYNELGSDYMRKDVAKARLYLNQAVDIARPINFTKLLSSTYSMLVYLMHDTGKPDSAEYYIGRVKKLYENAIPAEADKLGANYYSTSALYYRKTGAYNKAIPNFEKAIVLFRKIDDKMSAAGQTLNLGNSYQSIGNYKKAAEKHLQALTLFEEIGNKQGISFCYNSLANSFTQLKQYNQALKYFQKSFELKKSLGDKRGTGIAQSGLGDVYYGMKDYEKAIVYYQNAIDVAVEMKNMGDEKPIHLSLGKTYAAIQDIQKAEASFKKYKALGIQLKDSSAMAEADAAIISLKAAVADTAKGAVVNLPTKEEENMKQGLQLFEQRGDLTRQASGYEKLADYYVKNGDFENALFYTNRYHQITDSIHNTELQLQVLKMEEGYTSAKKEIEIQLLKKDQELQKQKLSRQRTLMFGVVALALLALVGIWLLINRNKLKHRMRELELRNQIAADLHDEVGSSLSSIHLLSQMAVQPGESLLQKNILEKMSMNAKETMDKMSDLVWTIKPEEAEGSNLKQRMERFAYEICGAKNIELSLQLEKLDTKDLNMEQRKNMYLIFKEALNNAVKYSGTEKVHISAVNGGNVLTMIVKDEGKGFNIKSILKGNGLDNIHSRAVSLGGTVTVDSEEGKGTIVKLVMPLKL